MRILDKTKNSILALDAGLADTMLSRMKGLLGRKMLGLGEGLILVPCSAIHTMWMSFAIDAIFFDRDRRVLAIIEELKPFRMSRFYPKARGVVELPAGVISAALVEVGDILDIR